MHKNTSKRNLGGKDTKDTKGKDTRDPINMEWRNHARVARDSEE